MSEFHRMVTYLYLYEGSQKTRNVGYAKIEKRDAHYRVEIHMKNTGLIEHDIPVYFYTQNNTGFPGILLGSTHFTRGAGEFKELVDSVDISNTGYNISNIKGIFCPVSDRQMILSQWDDDIFDRNAFFPVNNSTPEKSSISEESPALNATPASEANSTPASEANPAPASETNSAPTSEANSTPASETLDLKAAEAAVDLCNSPSESASPQIPDLKMPKGHSARWNFIMENFPPVAPFPSEASFEWVQLELKDLRLLPKSYWHLNNNSFLLHGFFNYHHLILGRKKDTQPCEWILGVPGVFQNPERVMATLFGFPDFHSTSEANTKTGQFGYWLRPLE